jgi:hypothetical protein
MHTAQEGMVAEKQTIGALKDEIKHRDRRIEELRREIDEQRDLIRRMEEHAENYCNDIEAWKETFDMVETERGTWTWAPFWQQRADLVADYNDLVRKWNRYLPLINGHGRPVGRPLAASEAQCDAVLKLRRQGYSLRGIAEETSLGLNTVVTIVSKSNGSDRTTKKHRARLERIDPSRHTLRWKRQHHTGENLPRRAQATAKEGRTLIKEAKGLGR